MRTALTAFAACLLLTASSLSMAQDGLFSKVSPGNIHGPSSSTRSTGRIESPSRLAGPASLSDALTRAGLQPTEISTQVISVKVERGGWSLPVLLTFSEDRNQIRMVMMLATLKEGRSPSVDQLVKLLDANRESSVASFAYSAKRRRVELHRLIANRSITGAKLRDELSSLGAFAERTQELWTIKESSEKTHVAQAKPQAAENSGSTPAPSSTPANTANQSLVGKWSAARSKTQAFALQLNSNGTFAFVTVINGKTSKSNGNYTLTGGKLTLVDTKGTRLTGDVALLNTNQFKFTPNGNNSAAVTFKRAT